MASLQQLDSWGSLDSLDAYGLNLEQLDQVTLHVTDGSASVSVTGALSVVRELAMQASVVGAAGVTASMKPIRQVTVTVNIAATQSSSLSAIRSATANQTLVLSASGVAALIRFAEAAENVSVATSAETSVTRPVSAAVSGRLSVTLLGKVLGEDWTNVAAGTEVWTDVTLGSEVWTNVSLGNEVWANQ